MESSPPMAAKNDDLVSEHPINSSDVELVKRPKLRFVGNVVIRICADGERSKRRRRVEAILSDSRRNIWPALVETIVDDRHTTFVSTACESFRSLSAHCSVCPPSIEIIRHIPT